MRDKHFDSRKTHSWDCNERKGWGDKSYYDWVLLGIFHGNTKFRSLQFNMVHGLDWVMCRKKGNSRGCQHLFTYIGLYQCPNDELQADNLHPFSEKRKWKWINHQSVPPQKQPHRKTMKEKRRPLNCRLLAFSRAFIGVHMWINRCITHRWRSNMYIKAQVILKLLHLPVYKNSIWTSQLSLKLYFLLWSVRQYIGCCLARLYFPSL